MNLLSHYSTIKLHVTDVSGEFSVSVFSVKVDAACFFFTLLRFYEIKMCPLPADSNLDQLSKLLLCHLFVSRGLNLAVFSSQKFLISMFDCLPLRSAQIDVVSEEGRKNVKLQAVRRRSVIVGVTSL